MAENDEQLTTNTPETPKKYATVDLAHFSMQFSDPKPQVVRDSMVIFSRGYDWITGTEAGQAPVLPALRIASEKAGYKLHEYKSNWVAVRKDRVVKGSYTRGGDTIVDNDETWGRGHDSNIAWIQFEDKELDRLVTVMSSHYPTRGQPDASPEYSVNLKWNKKLAHSIGAMAVEEGRGSALAFYGGDQNIVDRTDDTFFGAPMTSAWDELDKYENTGHGNIDVIASYDKDSKVEAVKVRALDDDELYMFSDHFPVEARYKIELLG